MLGLDQDNLFMSQNPTCKQEQRSTVRCLFMFEYDEVTSDGEKAALGRFGQACETSVCEEVNDVRPAFECLCLGEEQENGTMLDFKVRSVITFYCLNLGEDGCENYITY